jgi:hypothetical protein
VRDVITSGVKTGVQYAVATFVGWVAGFGIKFDDEALAVAAGSLALGVTAAVLNAAGKKWPVVNTILSLGLSKGSARYS